MCDQAGVLGMGTSWDLGHQNALNHSFIHRMVAVYIVLSGRLVVTLAHSFICESTQGTMTGSATRHWRDNPCLSSP